MPRLTLMIDFDSDPVNHVNDVLGTLHEVSMQLEDLRGEPLPPAGTVTDIQERQWASWAVGAAGVSYAAKPGDDLLWLQMGKRFPVTAIFTNTAEANAHMVKHSEQGLAAEFGPFLILANEKERK
jgi:hypothetical protein